MKEILLDTFIDSIKLLPFLFVTFLLMEYLEHRFSNKSNNIINKKNKFGPIIGSILGAFPQCGFGVSATNLYAARIITLGTLISIYLSTSDEMLPVLISEKSDFSLIASILIIKVIIGMVCGLIIDFIIKQKEESKIEDFCLDKHCDCSHGILKSSIKHTINIIIFIFIISLILNIFISYYSDEELKKIFLKNSVFSPFLASLIGLIPNCAASIILIELYLKKIISFGTVLAGLLSSSGVSLLVLFKTNKKIKENIIILLLVYFIGVIFGLIFNFIGINLWLKKYLNIIILNLPNKEKRFMK
mgnify:CR=1 FL=1